MGHLKSGGKYQYWNVKDGQLQHKNGNGEAETSGGFSGKIAGIRIKEGEFEGRPTSNLQILMHDTETGEDAVISGTLYYYTPSGKPDLLSVWARHLLSYLVNPRNQLKKEDEVEIRFWKWNESTCCGVQRAGSRDKLEQSQIAKDDLATAQKALEHITARYGEFGAENPEFGHYTGAELPPGGPPADDTPTRMPSMESPLGKPISRGGRTVQPKTDELPF